MDTIKCKFCGIGFKKNYAINKGAGTCPKCTEGNFEPKMRHDIMDTEERYTSLPFGANH